HPAIFSRIAPLSFHISSTSVPKEAPLMARKSAASLSVIAGSLDKRPGPPAELTAAEAEVWERTVAHEAADVFGTAALQQLLKDYCRHVVAAERLSAVIEKHLARASEPEPEA